MIVTIVTPTLNAVEYLKECIESARRNTTRGIEIEHVIVDGGSADGTVELARSYGLKVMQGKDSGIFDAITFIGNVPLVEEILVGADLLLLPSETESFGLAALEALSCEVPVIATAVGGLPEVVRHGENGYLFPVGDVDSMAATALELLQDEDKLRRFGREGRRWALERFEEDEIVERYRRIYRQVLED